MPALLCRGEIMFVLGFVCGYFSGMAVLIAYYIIFRR